MPAPHCLMHTAVTLESLTHSQMLALQDCMACRQGGCDTTQSRMLALQGNTVSTCAGRGPDLRCLLCRDPGFAGRHSLDTVSSVVRKANQVAPSSPAIASRVAAVLSRREREALARREAAQSSTAPVSHMSLQDAADLLDLESLPSGGRG